MPKKEKLAIGLLIIAVASRLVPHIPNFTALEATALFSGVYISRKSLSLILPIIAIYFSDLILNNTILRSFYPGDAGFIWISKYMLFTAIAMVGIVILGHILKSRFKPSNIMIYAVLGSLLFFIISNFGVWLSSAIYPKNIGGLIECYTLALPFFRNSILSNLLFTIVLFGGFELFTKKLLSNQLT